MARLDVKHLVRTRGTGALLIILVAALFLVIGRFGLWRLVEPRERISLSELILSITVLVLAWQSWLLRANIRSNTIVGIYDKYFELDKLFLAHPEFQQYGHSRYPPPLDSEARKVRSFKELVMDMCELVFYLRKTHPYGVSYIDRVFANPNMEEYWQSVRDSYHQEKGPFADYVDGTVRRNRVPRVTDPGARARQEKSSPGAPSERDPVGHRESKQPITDVSEDLVTLHSLLVSRIYHEDNLLLQRTYNFLMITTFLAATLVLASTLAGPAGLSQGGVPVLVFFIAGLGLLLALYQLALGWRTICANSFWRKYLHRVESRSNIRFDLTLFEFFQGAADTALGQIRAKGRKVDDTLPWSVMREGSTGVAIVVPFFVVVFWFGIVVYLANRVFSHAPWPLFWLVVLAVGGALCWFLFWGMVPGRPEWEEELGDRVAR
jgi:hypothetical protein